MTLYIITSTSNYEYSFLTNSKVNHCKFWVTIGKEQRGRGDIGHTGIISWLISSKWANGRHAAIVGSRHWWSSGIQWTPSWITQLNIHSHWDVHCHTQLHNASHSNIGSNWPNWTNMITYEGNWQWCRYWSNNKVIPKLSMLLDINYHSSYSLYMILTFNMNVFCVAIHLRSHHNLTSVLPSIRQSKRRKNQHVRIVTNLYLSSAIVLSPLVGDSWIGTPTSRHTTH